MYTFDVFDTLITRRTATPKGIFALMQKKLLESKEYLKISDYIKNNFYYLRINAEEIARHSNRVKGAEEVTLEEIYEAMAMTGSLTSDEIQQLIDLEKLTEYENVVEIKRNIRKVKDLINKGEKVILISDMYLDSKTIREMLMKVDPIFENINLYVSSEYKKSKWTGNIYKIVKVKEQVDYKDWIHCGDNPKSDIKSAERLGIKAELFQFGSLMPYEKKVLENNEDNYFIQLTIGAAKNTRIENIFEGPAAIGCSIGGLILFPYVWWILQESMKKGIKRLYFIARDGFVLKKIADIIIDRWGYDIETHYIYGSRRAWRMPSFSENNNDLYKFFRWSYVTKIKSIEELANLLQIPLEQFIKFLPEDFKDNKKVLNQFLISELVKKLNDDSDFKKYLRESLKEKRKMVADYLKQEVNVSDDAFAFIDLAGGGYTQGCMANIMNDFYDKKIRNFFFKLDQINVMNNCVYYNFLPSFLYLSLIIEMLCRAPHGQTMGYDKENGKIVPILKEDEGIALREHGFYDYLMGVEKFTKNYSSVVKSVNMRADNLKILIDYMDYITRTPDNEVLEFFGGMPNSVSGREKEVIEFAPILSKREIFSIFLWRTNEPIEDYYKGSSLEYSLLRCSEDDKKLIEFCKKHRNSFLGRLVHIFKKIVKPSNRYGLATDFPCEILGKRIVLYAAGKLGQDLYKKIKFSSKSRVVQWVDKNSKIYRKKGINVVDPKTIGSVEYDNVVIAVLNKDLAEEIRKELIEHGVPDKKIIWINLRPSWD